MELPDQFSAFWGTAVVPGKPCRVTVPFDVECTLTSAAVDQSADVPANGRVVLYVSVNGAAPVAVIPFTIGRFESSSLDLKFGGGDNVIFTTVGVAVPIHICGFVNDGLGVDIDNGVPPAETENPEQ